METALNATWDAGIGPADRVVVVGGGMSERFGEDFVSRIRERAFSRLLNTANLDKVRIVPSALGAYSGALGACVLSRKHLAAGTGAGVRVAGVRGKLAKR